MNRCGRWEIRIADRMQPAWGLTRDRAMTPHQEELLTVDRDNENRYYLRMESKNSPSIESENQRRRRATANRSVPRVSSRELMRRQSELIIEHDGREYRLRITHSGKLILTA